MRPGRAAGGRLREKTQDPQPFGLWLVGVRVKVSAALAAESAKRLVCEAAGGVRQKKVALERDELF